MGKETRWAKAPERSWWLYALLLMALCSTPLQAQTTGTGNNVAVPPPAPPKGRVARAMFTTDIVDREPINRVLVLSTAVHKVFFFTDLRHFEGETVVHHWYYDGKEVAAVDFKVNGPRWRVYSSKTLNPDDLGRWMVIVTDSRGWPLKASIFQYVAEGKGGEERPVILPPDAEQ